MPMYFPGSKDTDSPELARMVVEHMFCKRDLPDNIVIDQAKEFTRQFWN